MTSRDLGRAALLAMAIVALPISAYAAAEPAPKGSEYYTKRVCEVVRPTGSRLGGTRRCRTQAQIDQARAEDRQVLERIQSMKPSCNGNGLC